MSAWIRQRPLALLLVVAGILSFMGSADADWLPGWGYRQAITVQPTITPGNLADFPLLLKITDSANPVFAEAASPAGSDIVFTAADGVTILPREIEHFNTGATKELDAWVKTNLSSSAPTKLYMYYRGFDVPNSTDAWNGNYKMVQHLQESGATANSRLDSTSNLNHGTPYSHDTVTDLHTAAGRINGASEFDGSNDRVQVAHTGTLDLTDAVTIEAWIRPQTSKTAEMFMKGNTYGSYEFFQSGNDSVYWRLRDSAGSATMASSNKLTMNEWHHVAATYDKNLPSDNMKIFINGVQDPSTANYTATLLPNSFPFQIGAYSDDRYAFDGTIDEVRISDTARGADWIEAAYNNQSDPAAHQSVDGQTIGPWLGGWTHRQAIRISKDATDADLTDFPALIKITDPNNRIFAGATSPDGHDVVFTAADGITLLAHELEHFSSGSTKELDAWVKTPLSASEDTTIYMYYGGPSSGDPSLTDTWDTGHVMVQHLQESGATANSRLDSTANGNDGTPYHWQSPSSNDIVDLHTDGGLVNGADAFSGVGSGSAATESRRLQVADSTSLDTPAGEMTVEFWIRPQDQNGVLTMKGNAGASTTPFEFWRYSSNDAINARFKLTDGVTTTTVQTSVPGVLAPDDWHYVVTTFDGSLDDGNLKLYVDDVLVGNISTGSSSLDLTDRWLPTNNSPLVMGSYPNGLWPFYGIMDEYRLSNVARSGDWLTATWRLLNTSGSHLTFGPETSIPEPASVLLLVLGGLFLAGYARRMGRPAKRA